MSEGHQSKLLRTVTYKTKQTSAIYWKAIKKNGSKKQNRKFVRTQNKIKNIMPTNTQNKTDVTREVYKLYIYTCVYIYIYINLKTINPNQNE